MIFGHLSLHVDRTGAPRNEDHTMKGTVTLRCDHPRLANRQDTWQADFEVDFTHRPLGVVGIGPTTNGVDFDDDFSANAGDSWESLLITDMPFDEVLWYVQAPGDTKPGTNVQVDSGDGDTTTMSYTFPEGIRGAYRIRAEIWRNDGTGYWEYYTVDVAD